MAQDYWKAEDVEEIVSDYMKYHPELVGANIGCVFKEKATKSGDKPITGKITKTSGKYGPLLEKPYDFIMTVGNDVWMEYSQTEKEAWVDHILSHAYGVDNDDGSVTWKTRKPEVLMFPGVVERHGIDWMESLRKVANMDFSQRGATKTNDSEDSSEEVNDSSSDSSADVPESTTNSSYDDLTADI